MTVDEANELRVLANAGRVLVDEANERAYLEPMADACVSNFKDLGRAIKAVCDALDKIADIGDRDAGRARL